ncbi:MAG TPA: hypothetical protein VJ717_09245 [Gemmatimonadaceae bacterium]|nr:hypothetical protein [Gemmatimonadaceae bacterium]
MRTLHRIALVSAIALIGASCGNGGAQPNDELLRDLDAAQTSSIELAAKVQDYQPTRFVTAVEQLPSAAPTRARAPRRVYNPPAVAEVPEAEISTPAPEPAEEIVQTPVPTPEPRDVSAVPSVVSRPAATPATPAPSGDAEGRAEGPSRGEVLGTIIGEAIGVVIRGGPVGPGHCPPRRRPRGGIILPLEMPIVRR